MSEQPDGSHPAGGPPPPMPGRSLAESVFVLLGLNAAQRLVGFMRSILFCAWLSQEALGEWDMAFGFLVLAGPVVSLSLPAVLGRYVEFYRQRGHLRSLLVRIAGAVGLLGASASAALASFPAVASHWIFGRADRIVESRALAATLLATLAYGLLVEIFIALRMQARASSLDLVSSVVFAAAGAALILVVGPTPLMVLLAYGLSALVAVLAGLAFMVPVWRSLPSGEADAPLQGFWPRMLTFAGWAWAINWLVNLSSYADRYLIVHYSGLDADAALSLDGQYHAARLLPLLMISLSFSIAAILTPYLAHDLALGRRDLLTGRMNLVVKSAGLTLTCLGAALLAGAPLLFTAAWQGKFAAAREILPWMLAYGCWFSLFTLAKSYLWVEEQGRLVSLALFAGFAANVALNLALLPRLGLPGVAYSAVAAQLLALGVVVGLSLRQGLKFDRGALLAATLPATLLLGERLAPLLAAGLALLAWKRGIIFSAREKDDCRAGARRSFRFRVPTDDGP